MAPGLTRMICRLGAWLALAAGLAGACGGSDESARTQARREARGARPPEVAASAVHQPRAGVNAPPTARLEVRPAEGWAGLTMFHYDAGDCSDDSTHPSALVKRYDFDGDGTWDTGFQRGARVGHILGATGEYRPRVLVKDEGGLTDSATAGPVVVRPQCPPPDFALADLNPNSPTRGQTLRLSDQRGHPVLIWVVMVST